MSIEELSGRYYALSCSTYGDDSVAYPSSTDLDFRTVADALSSAASKFGQKPVAIDEFMRDFSANYQKHSGLKKLYTKMLVFAGSIGAAGVIYIVYALAQKLSEDTRELAVPEVVRRGSRTKPSRTISPFSMSAETPMRTEVNYSW